MIENRKRSRLVLLLLAVLFAAPLVAAMVLHGIGWEPTKTRNHGTLLQPPVDLREITPRRFDGTPYAWEPRERRWRIVVIAPDDCDLTCSDLIAGLNKVWELQGRRADRLDVLWFGDTPRAYDNFRRFVPMVDDADVVRRFPDSAPDENGQPPIYRVDPSGFIAMRYAPGADIAGLREDVARMLK